ncbi:Snf7-domain-containing protein [Pseudoneurospora amorphoporcata]|uniref:Snf7-domain-containing protein n=1 Tax=Pseudoneurospora amorphoporcata TaxID=241081 RepID=A0AAN6SDV4_9PEZI|nr:Snf7-domain-containing protein [Pseudoneurospora amorphoporcata]
MSNHQSLVDYLVEHEPSFRKARLPALYSDFTTLRTLNPDGYQANISAWRSALAHLARSGLAPAPKGSTPNLLVLNSDESLLRALESKKYGRPLALGTVIREALAAKDLLPLHDFLTSPTSIYYKPWLPSPLGIAGGVAGWALKQLGVADWLRSHSLPKGQFVVVANVEEAGKQFAATTASAVTDSRFERTWSKAHFLHTYNEQVQLDQGRDAKLLTGTDLDVLLTFLSRDKAVILYDGQTFKIKAPSDSHDSNDGSLQQQQITKEDTTIASIKELISSLTHQTHLLAGRISDLDKSARQAVQSQNRIAALAALKQKKLAEQTLQGRYASLTQLEAVAAKIQEASDSVAMVKIMETSTRVLESLNEQVGGVDRVENLTSKLREQMAEVDEVNTILAEAGGVGVGVHQAGGVDEEEIDEELEEMLAEEEGKREREKAAEQEEREREDREAEQLKRRLEAIGGVPVSVSVSEPSAATATAAATAASSTRESEREREMERLMKGYH